MLQKLKDLAAAIKGSILWILGPLLVLGITIYELINKIRGLEEKIQSAQGQEKLDEEKIKQQADDITAGDAVDAFEKLRGDNSAGGPSSGGEGDSGPKATNS